MYLGRAFVRAFEDALEEAGLEIIKAGHTVKFVCEQEPSISFNGITKGISFEFDEINLAIWIENEELPRRIVRDYSYDEVQPQRKRWFYSLRMPNEKTRLIPGILEF